MRGGEMRSCAGAGSGCEQEKSGMSDLEIAYAVSSPFGAGIETVCVKVVDVGCEPLLVLIGKSQTAGTLCVFFRKSVPTTPSMTSHADGDS